MINVHPYNYGPTFLSTKEEYESLVDRYDTFMFDCYVRYMAWGSTCTWCKRSRSEMEPFRRRPSRGVTRRLPARARGFEVEGPSAVLETITVIHRIL